MCFQKFSPFVELTLYFKKTDTKVNKIHIIYIIKCYEETLNKIEFWGQENSDNFIQRKEDNPQRDKEKVAFEQGSSNPHV